MKNSTIYLFGRTRGAYEPCLSKVATQKVDDARRLMQKLSREKETTDDMEALIKRYLAVEKSLNFWREILKEEA